MRSASFRALAACFRGGRLCGILERGLGKRRLFDAASLPDCRSELSGDGTCCYCVPLSQAAGKHELSSDSFCCNCLHQASCNLAHETRPCPQRSLRPPTPYIPLCGSGALRAGVADPGAFKRPPGATKACSKGEEEGGSGEPRDDGEAREGRWRHRTCGREASNSRGKPCLAAPATDHSDR